MPAPVKRFVTALLLAFLLVCVALAAGLRFNGSKSFPLGLYWAIGKNAHKGDLVFVHVPELPVFAMAKERGYLDVAYSPARHILKRLVGHAGDRVTIDLAGVRVNGILLANSAPLPCDSIGRPLQACLLTDYVLQPDEVLLMSEYNPASFDSRYFGPVRADAIESVVTPLLTWN